jgi:hypothetical protein
MTIQIASMLKSTLALTLIAASATAAQAAPLGNLIHLHPHAADTRIGVVLVNDGERFQEVVIEGKTYEIQSHHTAFVKAPAGTVVYAGANVLAHKKGTMLLEVKNGMNGKTIHLS